MRRSWFLFFIAVGVSIAASLTRHLLVPNVVPISVESPEIQWTLQAAFLLQAIENIGALGAFIVIVAAVAGRLEARRKGSA